jgi:hypothetical protein
MSIIAKCNEVNPQPSSLLRSSLDSVRHEFEVADIPDIHHLDIAEGLKELLIAHGMTLELLSEMSSNELVEIFGFDQYIAGIILNSAKTLKSLNREQLAMV